MKQKKRLLLTLTALVVCLSLLLNGCAATLLLSGIGDMLDEDIFDLPEITQESTEREPTASLNPAYDWDGERLEDSDREPISFDEISYERPDTQALCDRFHSIQTMVESTQPLSDILDAFEPLYEDYTYFYTLSNYAYIRYCLNLNDSYYETEYNWCEEQSPVVEQAMEKCYIAMADSPLRDELENEYFGEGFFLYYDDNQIYSNDRVVELMQEESTLEAEYMALQNEVTITWNGKECLLDDLLSDPYIDVLSVYRLYYEKYNPLAADIYVKLVRVRQEMAQELGYESYPEFAYEYYYGRDYTPEQVEQYTTDIATELSDFYYTAATGSYSSQMDTDTVMEKLGDIAAGYGGEFAVAYDFMTEHSLYDITSSSSKMPGSYVTYLHSYGMPYLYVSPTGTIDDLLTAVHEFGHFVDGYVNCNHTSSIDCAEIFSQGLEYLSLSRAGLSRSEERELTASKLCDSILVFLAQGCYAEFEQKVYSLPDERLTAEGINQLFLECNEKFGMGLYGYEDIVAPGWIEIQHFFIAPCYVISYCISNDAALQVYQRELEDGSGLETYRELLQHSADNTVLALLEEAGMDSPFTEGRMKSLAAFFEEKLD